MTSGPLAPLLIVFCGPSGVGKDVVLTHLQERGHRFHRAVTATTRPRRSDEVDGEDYFFVSEEAFAELQCRGELLEHALVYGHHYGVPKEQIRQAHQAGRDVLVRTDVQGAAAIKAAVPQAVTIFIMPGSLTELEQRLRQRGSETAAVMKLRLAQAAQEIAQADHFDYVVVNRQGALEEAVDRVEAILAAERRRTGRQPILL